MAGEPSGLWEIHLRIPADGPVAVACKRGGDRLLNGVVRLSTPAEALELLERLLAVFREGDQLFITARTHDTSLSMWSTRSRAAGLYWCATALSQLWRPVRSSFDKTPPWPALRREEFSRS